MSSIKEFILRKGAATRTPVNGSFELTPRCNFSCKMCYIHMSAQEALSKGRELSTAEWIEMGKKAVENGALYILLTGGEPLLRPDFKEIYTSLVKMGLMVAINTNGSLIDDELIECFQTYRPERINITLYGVTDETYLKLCAVKGAWQRVSENIDKLLKAGILITVNTTFTKLNIGEMERIIAFAESRGIPIRMSGHIFPPVRGGSVSEDVILSPCSQGIACSDFDKMSLDEETLIKRRKSVTACFEQSEADEEIINECSAVNCMAGKSSFWISWDANMYPCGMLPKHGQNIRETEFSVAWKNIVAEAEGLMLPKECTCCKFKRICTGCAAAFECSTGRTDRLDKTICEKTKAYAEEILR